MTQVETVNFKNVTDLQNDFSIHPWKQKHKNNVCLNKKGEKKRVYNVGKKISPVYLLGLWNWSTAIKSFHVITTFNNKSFRGKIFVFTECIWGETNMRRNDNTGMSWELE